MIKDYMIEISKFIKQYYPKSLCYIDQIPQNFKGDSFLIECLSYNIEENIHNIYDIALDFSLTFFSSTPSQSSIIDVLMFLDLEFHHLLNERIYDKEIVDVRQDQGTMTFSIHKRVRKIDIDHQMIIQHLNKIKGV